MVEVPMEPVEHNNSIEGEPDATKALNGGTLENGLNKPDDYLDAKGQGACQKFMKKNIKVKITVVIVFSLLFLGSFTGNIIQAVTKKQWQDTPSSLDGCPDGWIKKEDSCYFFSDVEKNWNISQTNCSSYGASLVTLDSEPEWDLVKSRQDDNWIGLQREKADQPWKWPDGSNVTQFKVQGTGLCGFMNGDAVSSTSCDNSRRWICKKQVRAA